MSPAAREFEHVFQLPTISTDSLSTVQSTITSSPMSIVYKANSANVLIQDWMRFTNLLGTGILREIS